MSCNGCRVLRKGCSESCILRPCLQWIDNPESQGHATVFVAKFFGRAGLMSFISAVPENQRPALFQSLLYEACGRTVNPVSGAVGLLGSGNWLVCQSAVDTVLRGGTLRPWPEVPARIPVNSRVPDDASEASPTKKNRDLSSCAKPSIRQGCGELPELPKTAYHLSGCSKPSIRQDCGEPLELLETKLNLSLSSSFTAFPPPAKQRPGTPSMNSEGSVTSLESGGSLFPGDHKLLNLFY